MTLSQKVESLACKKTKYESLAGEMLATIKLNIERGHLVTSAKELEPTLASIIAGWERQMQEIEKNDY